MSSLKIIGLIAVVVLAVAWFVSDRQSIPDLVVEHRPVLEPEPKPTLTPVAPPSLTVQISMPLEALGSILERIVPEEFSGASDLRWGIDMKWGVTRNPFVISGNDGELIISTAFRVESTLSRRIILSTARATADAEANALIRMRPEIGEDWKIIPNLSTEVNVDHDDLKIFGLFNISLSDVIEPYMKDRFSELSLEIESTITNSEFLKRSVMEQWMSLCRSTQISSQPDVWLETVPESVSFTRIQIEDNHLRFEVGIDGAMQVSDEQSEPTCDFPESNAAAPDESEEVESEMAA